MADNRLKGSAPGVRKLLFEPGVLHDIQRRAHNFATATGAQVKPLERGLHRPRVAVVGRGRRQIRLMQKSLRTLR